MNNVEHLISTFIPENYNLFLDIDRPTKTFTGNVAITGEALAESIGLHQKDLEIVSIKLDNNTLDYTMDDENEMVRIQVDEVGHMTLVIEFSGKITDNMTGMYPSYYTVDGVKKEIIATQFESHFAREVFPCVDEPEAKATFDLSIKFDEIEGVEEVVLSNMPEIEAELRQETGIWRFETTPRMSSYLLAFALGDIQGQTTTTNKGTKVGVFSTKAHALNHLDFALDIAKRCIEFYEDYYGVAYPIPHSYHIALPDFSAGAMENWGLVTYREVYLVVDENSTVTSRQQVALVIAHELAHQWFGNLVTMKWWDDLWLNESFANMMEYVSIDAIEPEWNIMEDFQNSGVPLSLTRDATDGVQSVHVAVNHPDEINTLFDPAIVYAKGSRLMHMLRRWLGDDAFSRGLNAYFEKHQYGNTIGRDLWNALGDASGKDVASFMNSWLVQPGYPLVTVSVEGDDLILEQKQFFIGEHEEKGRLWHVPLNSNWQGLPDILTEERTVIAGYAKLAQENEGALRLNTENTAHYLVNYTGETYGALEAELADMNPISKLQFLEERRFLAEAGVIDYSELVPLVANLTDETSNLVVSAISQIIKGLGRFIDEDSQEEAHFNQLIRQIFKNNYARLGFEPKAGESDEDEFVRQTTLSNLIAANYEKAISEAKGIFEAHQGDIESIPAAIRLSVLINQMKHFETEELVDLYFATYQSTANGVFKAQLARAISYTTNEAVVKRITDSFKDKDIIKPQDLASSWLFALLGHEFTQEPVWDWVRSEWDWIQQTLGGDMSSDKFIIYPANAFKTEERLAEFKTFFEPKLDQLSMKRFIEMGIKEISARVDLINRQKSAVSAAVMDVIDD